jgi:hypothetical protein
MARGLAGKMISKPRIELLYVPGCPLRDRVRAALYECLAETGVRAVIEEREGAYPSPTLLIDGLDVITANPPVGPLRCRLDLPTREQIHAALTGTDRE